MPGKGEDYLYEKITRRSMAESAEEIKAFAKEYVETGKTNQIEGTSRPFHDSLKEILFLKIKKTLNSKLMDYLIVQVKKDKDGESILIMVSLYYSIYKNTYIPGYVLHPFFFRILIPFLTISQKKFPENIVVWQKMLHTKLLNSLKSNKEGTYNLKVFFEDKSVQKIISISFAGILAVMKEDKELTEKFFFRTNHLNEFHLKTFTMYIANGYYTSIDKPKRFLPKRDTNDTPDQSRKVKAVPIAYISDIITSLVDSNFNKALEMIIQYYQLGNTGQYKKHLLKNYNRVFQDMNQKIWKEIRKLVETQMQVAYRNKFLLRLVIHYVFDKSDSDREFWIKYIPNVEKVIQFIYKGENEHFIKINEELNQINDQYKETRIFQGTDWEGFYKDPASKIIALQVIQTIVDKGGSKRDKNIPAAWFTNLMIKEIDEIALFRYFRRGLKNV